MKSLLTIFLVVLYTVALIRPVYPLLEYVIKMEEYKARCINKAKPEMHCNGKCILMQKLRTLQLEEPGPVAPVLPKINPDDFPFCIAHHIPIQVRKFIVTPTYGISLIASEPRHIIVDIFRPPQA